MRTKIINILLRIFFAFIQKKLYIWYIKNQNLRPMKKTILLTLILTLAFWWQSLAQQVQVGYGTETGSSLPIEAFFGYSYSQQIYLASEIGDTDGGTITAIKFYFNGDGITNSNDWTVYIGHTNKTEFSSTSDWVPVSNLTQVYSGTITANGPGWITIDINDWNYNGTDNIVVAIDENQSGYDSSSDDFYATATTTNRGIIYYSDGTNPDPANPPSGGLKQFYPNIIFVGLEQSCPAPIDLNVEASPSGSATVTWDANGASSWNLEYGPAGFTQGSGTMVNGLTSPTYTINNLTLGDSYDVYVQADCSGSGNGSSNWIQASWRQPFSTCSEPVNLNVEPQGGCASATPYTLDFSTADDVGHFSCDNYGTNTGRWFSFTAPNSGKVKIIFSSSSAEFSILSDCNGTEVACPGYSSDTEYEISDLTAGNTYILAVWKDNASSGSVDVCLEEIVYSDPVFTLTPVPDCNNTQFSVDVEVTDLGGSNSVTVSDDQGSATQQLSSPGTVTFGPYPEGTNVTFTVTSDDDNTVSSSQSIQYYCPPANDMCSSAEMLTVSNSCNPTTGTNQGATDSGAGNPGCAYYQGGDIWYTFTVPNAVGNTLVVETSSVSGSDVHDTGMAVYTGDCNNLSLVECDDDGGSGNFSKIIISNPNPGDVYYVRVWEFGNNSFGQIGVCAYAPNLAVNNLTVNDFNFYPNPTQGTIRWTATETPTHLSIVNISGQVLYEANKPESNVIDISQLPAGVYMLHVTIGDRQGTFRVIKE